MVEITVPTVASSSTGTRCRPRLRVSSCMAPAKSKKLSMYCISTV